MNTFFLIDKPLHISSFGVLRKLKKFLNIKKMGHTGTLDPLASGCLLVAVGNYTKLIPYLEKDKKEYKFEISLDGVSDSFDLGEEIQFLSQSDQEKHKKTLTIKYIQDVLNKNFVGKITQMPPKYSALKIGGKRACDLMRQGKEVTMKLRKVEIFNLQLLDFSYPKLKLKATVSAGTYIRSIAADLGKILGTGGYISQLRRTQIGILSIDKAQGEYMESDEGNIAMGVLLVKDIFPHIPFISLSEDILEKINHGLTQRIDEDFPENTDLFVAKNNEITNIVRYENGILQPIRKI